MIYRRSLDRNASGTAALRIRRLIGSLALGALCGCSPASRHGVIMAVAQPVSSAAPKQGQAPAQLPEQRFAVFFPPDSAELPPAEQERLEARCRQLGEYVAKAGDSLRGLRLHVGRSGHADVREKDGLKLATQRREAVDRVLARCAAPLVLCSNTKDQNPQLEGDAPWHKVQLLQTPLRGADRRPVDKAPTSSNELTQEKGPREPRMEFLPDSDQLRPDSASAWADRHGPCVELRERLANWMRGLFVVGYGSSGEVDASALPARRAAAAIRVLTGTCGLDAAQLFAVAMPAVQDPEPASQRRRVDLDVILQSDPGATKAAFCEPFRSEPPRQLYNILKGDEVFVPDLVYFKKGSSVLSPLAVAQLGDLCRALEQREGVLKIQGSSAPDEADGGPLSQERAKAVQRQFVSCGVDPERLRAQGQGVGRYPGVEIRFIP